MDVSKHLPGRETRCGEVERSNRAIVTVHLGLTERGCSEQFLLQFSLKLLGGGQDALIYGVAHDPLLQDDSDVLVRALALFVVFLR